MHQDAKRCLKCKNALCQKFCPVHTDVPTIIALYNNDDKLSAQTLLFDNNPLSAVCSLVCDWQRQCYGHCVLNAKKDPIHFYEIEQELSLEYLQNSHFSKNEITKDKVAIVGAGPAGIVAAIKLSDDGYNVTIFEKQSYIGGVLRYGIPEFRLAKDIVDNYARILKEKGIAIRNNVEIGVSLSLQQLKDDGFKAILVATGASKPKGLNIKNETASNVAYAIDFLKNSESFVFGKKIIVLGGGNVAIDAARSANKLGYDTYIYYRKTLADMPANVLEVEEAIEEGVKICDFEVPMEIVDGGMIFAKGENVISEDGRKKTRIIDNTEHFVECDGIIVAVSQTLNPDLKGELALNKYEFYDTNEDRMTSMDGVFVAGDAYLGAKTVVMAVQDAKEAVDKMKAYLESKHG